MLTMVLITVVTGKKRRITLLECPPDLPGAFVTLLLTDYELRLEPASVLNNRVKQTIYLVLLLFVLAVTGMMCAAKVDN
jgi:hypothetical protein